MAGISHSNKRKSLPVQSPTQGVPGESPKITGAKRSKRTTQGQGGAAVQLEKWGEQITSKPVAKKSRATAALAATGDNPMAPQPARPKPRPLAKASPLPCTRTPGPPVSSQAPVQSLPPAAGILAGIPHRADALEGSVYGFRRGFILPAAPAQHAAFQAGGTSEPPIDPALYTINAQLHGSTLL